MSEVFGGFSGLKYKMLLAAGFTVFLGLVWGIGKDNFGGQLDGGGAGAAVVNWSHAADAKSFVRVANMVDPLAAASIGIGTSFIVAILLGSLMRVSFRGMVILLAIIVGVSIALDYKGVVEPFWSEYVLPMSELKQKLLAQTESTRAFLLGHFPPFASAIVGFGCGLKR